MQIGEQLQAHVVIVIPVSVAATNDPVSQTITLCFRCSTRGGWGSNPRPATADQDARFDVLVEPGCRDPRRLRSISSPSSLRTSSKLAPLNFWGWSRLGRAAGTSSTVCCSPLGWGNNPGPVGSTPCAGSSINTPETDETGRGPTVAARASSQRPGHVVADQRRLDLLAIEGSTLGRPLVDRVKAGNWKRWVHERHPAGRAAIRGMDQGGQLVTEWHSWNEVRDELSDALGSTDEQTQRREQLRRERALQRLVEMRKRTGLTQADAAERMGVSKAPRQSHRTRCGRDHRPARPLPRHDRWTAGDHGGIRRWHGATTTNYSASH
jgi:hypothetical protein